MHIAGLQKLSLIDYPGKLAVVVFFAGCPFRCPWCHNPDLVLPERIKDQPKISEKEILSFLKQRKGLLEAVVLSGGEPTLNPELAQFCEKIKKLGYLIKLDTNGSNPGAIEELLQKGLIDYVALDVKASKEKYAVAIGMPELMGFNGEQMCFWAEGIVANVEEAIQLLKKSGIDYEFRTTVVPTIVGRAEILKIVKWIGPAKKYYLQEFRSGETVAKRFKQKRPYARQRLTVILKAISPFFDECGIRE